MPARGKHWLLIMDACTAPLGSTASTLRGRTGLSGAAMSARLAQMVASGMLLRVEGRPLRFVASRKGRVELAAETRGAGTSEDAWAAVARAVERMVRCG